MSLLKEINEIPASKKDLKKFAFTIGIFLGLLGAFFLWRGKEHAVYFLGVSIFFILSGILFPNLLKPIQKIWMTMALLMGWVMTRVILGIVFFLVMTPIGLIIRLSGKDLLNQKFPGGKDSYWLDRSPREKDSYENQF